MVNLAGVGVYLVLRLQNVVVGNFAPTIADNFS